MSTDDLRQVGPRLRPLRLKYGWPLDELAGRTHMPGSTLSCRESGKRQTGLELLLPPTPPTRELGVSLDGPVITPLTPAGSPFNVVAITYPPTSPPPPGRARHG
ncbi:helix-turn-helix domain-containing protein [uncultured Corynebacterium sp.]|uniref:helix-turn-helix domain-containing protein n=1 Tax=uncultured Corynebacterium sp. TaxID=159447 RepID=UPI0025D77F84|nr:helix-turn-helix transcriptional regulator [uncultured Corynebacterium sp.]